MLSVGIAALLGQTIGAGRVAVNLEASTREVQRIDGAMEMAINAVRSDLTVCGENSFEPAVYDGFVVECNGPVIPSTPDPPLASRTMDLKAYTADGAGDPDELVGKTRVRVADEVNGQSALGYSMEVCDWLLGGVNVSEEIQGCSA